MITAAFQQGMESVSSFRMNTVTDWLIYDLITYGVLFSVTELIWN